MMAPHTSSLAFSFLACTCALLGMAPHTPSLAFSFLACACALLGWLRTRQILLFLFWRVPVPCWEWLRTRQVLLFLFWRVLVPCWGCSAHAKSCFFFSGVCLLSSTSSASHGNAPSLRSAAGRRLALELLTSSASQPPHSYLRASIGSMRAALFAG